MDSNDVHSTWYAFISMARDNGTSEVWHSNNALSETETHTSQSIGGTNRLALGAFDHNGTNGHNGHIVETGWWNIDDSDESTLVAKYKIWTAAAYGVVWA